MHEHFLQFYEHDAHVVDQIAAFVRGGLSSGETAIVIATSAHRAEIEKRLGIPDATALVTATGYYESHDAHDVLEKILVDGELHEALFVAFMEPVFRRAAERGNGRLRIYGEIVGILCEDARHDIAVELERLWNVLAETHRFTLFCGYPIRAFPGHADGEAFLRICDEHSRVVPAESYKAPANAHEYFRTIARLQQNAVALKTEIARCRQLEQRLTQREQELADLRAASGALFPA